LAAWTGFLLSKAIEEGCMAFFVKKLEWEYGESYGHVLHPQSLKDVDEKLQELVARAHRQNYPFYIEVFCVDDTYLGLIVGHARSCFIFGIFVSDDQTSPHCRTQFDGHYDSQYDGHETFITYSFKGDHGERRWAETLPQEHAFAALFQYIEHQTLPATICLSRQALIDTYRR
jgi:hypothetical protein